MKENEPPKLTIKFSEYCFLFLAAFFLITCAAYIIMRLVES